MSVIVTNHHPWKIIAFMSLELLLHAPLKVICDTINIYVSAKLLGHLEKYKTYKRPWTALLVPNPDKT